MNKLALVIALALLCACGQDPPAAAVEPVPLGDRVPIDLRIASLNAWFLPLGASSADDDRMARLGPALDALAPDVACFQELWTQSSFDDVTEALAPRLPFAAEGGGGLALYSRWPISERVFYRFGAHESLSLVERLGGKGYLAVVIETPAGPIRVIDSHLVLDRGEGRAAQAAQLLTLVSAHRAELDMPTFICADLNIRAIEGGAPSESFALLRDAGYEDAAGTAAGPDGRWRKRAGTRVGWPRQGRTARWDPDYILYRDGATATVTVEGFQQALDTPETAVSDHNLQVADFRVTPTAEADE